MRCSCRSKWCAARTVLGSTLGYWAVDWTELQPRSSSRGFVWDRVITSNGLQIIRENEVHWFIGFGETLFRQSQVPEYLCYWGNLIWYNILVFSRTSYVQNTSGSETWQVKSSINGVFQWDCFLYKGDVHNFHCQPWNQRLHQNTRCIYHYFKSWSA